MFNELKLDLQSFAKRVYDSVLYQSTFYNFLNPNYIGTLRQTGAPVIEVAKTDVLSVNVRQTKEIQTALDPALTTYTHTLVDLTELNMDYAIRVPIMVTGSDITNAIQDAADLEDSAIANQIDIYGYGKLAANTSIVEVEWNPSTKEEYISALTTVIKFENMEINGGVTLGEIARVYGISIFEINNNVMEDAVGYFFNPIAVVGDTFMSAFVSTSSDIRYPGYFCLSGTQSFGAEVVRPEAIIRLVEQISG